MEIFGKTLTHLEQSLDLRLERQELLSSNIANADTPGFVPRDIDFSSALADAEAATSRAELTPAGEGASVAAGTATAPAREQTGSAPGFDGNRVNLDEAMVALAENGLQYGAAATMAQKKLQLLSYIASDGNG
jgi:flagellar basal-body rod protein FlgB